MSNDPRLYPVTLDLVCPAHGLPKRITVTSLRAQQQWTDYFQQVHAEALGCNLPLDVLVPDRSQQPCVSCGRDVEPGSGCPHDGWQHAKCCATTQASIEEAERA